MAPLPESAPPEISADSTNGLSVGAFALEGPNTLERFEANLPLAGVIAVDIRLVNKSARSIDGSGLQFELHDASGKNLKPLSSKKALDRVMDYYGARFYLLVARQRTRDDYEAVTLKPDAPIRTQEERRGILFFQTDRETTDLTGLTLWVKGAAVPMSLQLTAR